MLYSSARPSRDREEEMVTLLDMRQMAQLEMVSRRSSATNLSVRGMWLSQCVNLLLHIHKKYSGTSKHWDSSIIERLSAFGGKYVYVGA